VLHLLVNGVIHSITGRYHVRGVPAHSDPDGALLISLAVAQGGGGAVSSARGTAFGGGAAVGEALLVIR
jgi:hypothetical protein